jgi:DNA-binding ferritin-like protein (Dps family)
MHRRQSFAKFLWEHSGQEPTDPAKVAQLILKLTNQEEVPLRPLIGTDAVQYANALMESLQESFRAVNRLSGRYSSVTSEYPTTRPRAN